MKRGMPWGPQEVAKLEELAGDVPRLALFQIYRRWATTHGLPPRTNDAIEAAAYHRKISLAATGNCLTPHRIAQILGIPHDGPDKWCIRGLLKAQRHGSGDAPVVRYIRRPDLMRFAREHPRLLGGIPAARLNCLLENEELAEQIASTYPRRPWYKQPVACVETGRRFPTIRSAAREVFITRQSIVYAIKTGGTAAGYHWQQVAA